MVLHHIPQGTCRFVKPAALLDAEILDGCDFYVVDIVAVPKRLEDSVGKPESQYVLGSLFAKEVVDAVNLPLIED